MDIECLPLIGSGAQATMKWGFFYLKPIMCVLVLFLVCLQNSFCVLQNFDTAKKELRLALGQEENGPLSIITVARTPNPPNTTVLISHDEFEQVLRLLYPLCSGSDAPHYLRFANSRRIPFWSTFPLVDRVRNLSSYHVVLNNAPSVLAEKWPDDIVQVSNMSKDFKALYNMHLKRSCNIVVFNEMFFSQTNPLTEGQKDFISNKILDLSQTSRYCLFYPNFLYTKSRKITGSDIFRLFMICAIFSPL